MRPVYFFSVVNCGDTNAANLLWNKKGIFNAFYAILEVQLCDAICITFVHQNVLRYTRENR